MQRAMQVFLNLPDATRTREDDEFLPLERVIFMPQVRETLLKQLEVRGHWQGGALFGSVSAGTLSVRVVGPLGPPTWQQPLQPHLPYLLGWSDSLCTQFGTTLDWYGNWIAAPDGRLPNERADLTWLAHGARQGLFDDRHALVVVGLTKLALSGRAYSCDEGESISLECSFDAENGNLFGLQNE